MANIVEQTPNTADKTICLLDNIQISGTMKKIDYSSVRGKVIFLFNIFKKCFETTINISHILYSLCYKMFNFNIN